MKGKLRSAAIALIAALALTAAAAPGAQAGKLMTVGNVSGNIEATQVAGKNLVFTLTGQKTECEKVKLTGPVATSPTTVFTMHPEFSGCEAFGFNATVTTTGCDLEFEVGETIGETGKYTGKVNLKCALTEDGTHHKIIINSGFGTCEAQIGDTTKGGAATNQGLETVEFENMAGSPEDITVNANVTNIYTNVTKSNFPCPLTKADHGPGTGRAGASITGLFTVTAKTTSGEPVGLTLEM